MVEILEWMLEALVVVSLIAVASFLVMFVAVASWTVLTARHRDPLAADLDEVLGEILGRPEAVEVHARPGRSNLVEPSRSHTGWHR